MKSILDEIIELLGYPTSQIMSMTNVSFWSKFPIFKDSLKSIKKIGNELFAFYDEQIGIHKKLFDSTDEKDEPTNYVQAFLMEKHRREKNGEDIGSFT